VGYETQAAAPNAAALIKTPVPAGTYSVYTRVPFTVASAAAVTHMLLGADYDDGLVAFINGVEVYGSPEIPGGPLAWNTNAGLHESGNGAVPNYGTPIDITARAKLALHDGVNILAIGVWNSGAASSTDLVLVPRLSIGMADVCDGVDNDCDGLVDEGFPDFDQDGRADCVDNDDDNDGAADGADCAPLNGSASAAPPAEANPLNWVRSDYRANVLDWNDQGGSLLYDLMSGLIADLKVDGNTNDAACLVHSLSVSSYDDPRPDPPAGQAYYYDVRARSGSCGAGPYGATSAGVPHIPALACP